MAGVIIAMVVSILIVCNRKVPKGVFEPILIEKREEVK